MEKIKYEAKKASSSSSSIMPKKRKNKNKKGSLKTKMEYVLLGTSMAQLIEDLTDESVEMEKDESFSYVGDSEEEVTSALKEEGLLSSRTKEGSPSSDRLLVTTGLQQLEQGENCMVLTGSGTHTNEYIEQISNRETVHTGILKDNTKGRVIKLRRLLFLKHLLLSPIPSI